MASKPTTSSSSAAITIFRPGTLVEISNDVEGYYGSWFTGKIVCCLHHHKFVVEYDKIMVDEEGTMGVQETVNLSQLRPIPPKEIIQDLQVGDEVDAYDRDGWWEGRISGNFENGMWAVYFKDWSEQLAYPEDELRRHHNWVNGSWIPPFPQQDDDSKIKETERVNAAETVTGDKDEFKFEPGTLVEVCSKEDGFQGAWFCATLIEPKAGLKFVVEYESFVDDDDNYKLLREEINMHQIRPRPPKTDDGYQFQFLDEVDAYYNDGWWVGVVSNVTSCKYGVRDIYLIVN
ncbi:unnamed protein product [Lathyrus sativus]|nr:unnamed protein product [Lathyrus sativus]